MDRRGFLTSSLALGCSAAASPLLTPIAMASAPGEGRLVVIILRGAMDGLDAVPPLGDRDYAPLRPTLADGGALALGNGFWGLHPALAPVLPLWESGEFGAVHAVSTPYRDRRSHFDGQDILEAGTPGLEQGGWRDGWLNRMLTALPGARGETAYAIGREQMLILQGAAPVSRWSPDARLRLTPQARRLLEMVHHDDPLFRDASAEAMAIVDQIESEAAGDMAGGMSGERPSGDHMRLVQFAAQRLRAETRIVSFSMGGWDTHGQQERGLTLALDRLAQVILGLKEGLGPVWGQTAVLCLTEFGRTARENGTRGTDHGTAGAMLYAGGALRGGLVGGDWPGLSESALYAGRDLMPTRDVRAHAAWVMRAMFGLERGLLETTVFPGLDLGPDPGLVL